MWFKTQAGLVNVEGTAQYVAWKSTGKKLPKSIWLTAYQAPRDEMEIKLLFRKLIRIRGNYIYLAGFNDDERAERSLADCMRRIESAIQNSDAICDLSDVGERSLWQKSDRAKPVNWKA